MPVTIVIEVVHTVTGLVLKPEIKTLANGHCKHEMMFATSAVEATCEAAKELNEMINKSKNKRGEHKYVH
ncbi:hypothetical protein ACWKX9_05730 [Enterobacter asburiae]